MQYTTNNYSNGHGQREREKKKRNDIDNYHMITALLFKTSKTDQI